MNRDCIGKKCSIFYCQNNGHPSTMDKASDILFQKKVLSFELKNFITNYKCLVVDVWIALY